MGALSMGLMAYANKGARFFLRLVEAIAPGFSLFTVLCLFNPATGTAGLSVTISHQTALTSPPAIDPAESAEHPDINDSIDSLGQSFPGVMDHLFHRPQDVTASDLKPGIHINYPSIGNHLVDADIRQWVDNIAEAFTTQLDLQICPLPQEDVADAGGTHGRDLQTQMDATDDFSEAIIQPNFELWGEYMVSRPSDAAVSISFELWNYTGPQQANLDIVTLNYSLLTGQRLNFVDIFEKPDVALELMSSWARKVLEPRLGATRRSQMLTDGTAPRVENFSSLTLTPDGICINFQPWQVAPWDAGIQKVIMPLEELLPSSPLMALWGK